MSKKTGFLTSSDYASLCECLTASRFGSRRYKKILSLFEMNKNSTLSEVSAIVEVSILTLQKWRKAYLTQGVCFLEEKPRSGRPTSFSGTVRAQITSLACSDAPEGYSRWSLRLLADKLVELAIVEDISYETVGVILKKTNSAPT